MPWIDCEKLEDCPDCGKPLDQSEYDMQFCGVCRSRSKSKGNLKVEKNMNFSQALAYLKVGKRLQRAGWNGKGMFVFLVAGSNFKVNREPLLSIMGKGAEVTYCPHIDMKTADNKVVPWIASQTDIMADDWQVVSI